MVTDNEKKVLIRIFKDINSYYNANSLSKKIGLSRIGVMKMLRKFEKEFILKSNKIGKSVVYKINLENDYARDMIAFLLSDEANNFKRWKKEFDDLFKGDRIVLIYGSAIKNYSKAKDIDLMLIGKLTKEMGEEINKKQKILPKEVHLIEISYKDFLKNIEKKQESIIDIVQNVIVLYGQNKYVKLIKNVKSF